MSARIHTRAQARRWQQGVACVCAALVLALTIFAASPEAHQALHADHHTGPCQTEVEDSCAVVLFAGGVGLPVGPVAIIPPTSVVRGVSPVTAAEVFLVSPRYLRQPERGPPVSRAS